MMSRPKERSAGSQAGESELVDKHSRYAKSQVESNIGQQAVNCDGYGSRFRLAVSTILKQGSKKIIYSFHPCISPGIQRSSTEA